MDEKIQESADVTPEVEATPAETVEVEAPVEAAPEAAPEVTDEPVAETLTVEAAAPASETETIHVHSGETVVVD